MLINIHVCDLDEAWLSICAIGCCPVVGGVNQVQEMARRRDKGQEELSSKVSYSKTKICSGSSIGKSVSKR